MASVSRSRAITTGENLAGPIALVVAMLLGLGAIAIVLLAFPYFVSVVLRWLGAGAWAGRVADGLSIFMLVGMSVFVIRELMACYRAACASVATGEHRSSAQVCDRVL
jgi:hypothetical protein